MVCTSAGPQPPLITDDIYKEYKCWSTLPHCQCLVASGQASSESICELLPVQVLPNEHQLAIALLIWPPGPASTLCTAAELQQHVDTLEHVPGNSTAAADILGPVSSESSQHTTT